jgi:tight adherence protein B
MDIIALGAALSVFGFVLFLALAIYSGREVTTQVRGRLEGVLSGASSVVEGPTVAPLRQTRSVAGIVKFLVSGEWLEELDYELRQAESKLHPTDFIALRIALTGLGFAAPYILLGGVMGTVAGLAGAVAGFWLPRLWINNRIESRNKKMEEQLPETLTLISNSLKSGFGLLQALSLAAEQLEPPISTELEQTIYEMNVGSSADEALLNLSSRTRSYDLDLVVTAILVQRAVGGNLSEILETVAATMRERVRIRGEIQTLTAQQRMTGMVIGLLPVGVGALFLLISPDYISLLFTETIGRVMLAIAVIMELIGLLVIRRILSIEV